MAAQGHVEHSAVLVKNNSSRNVLKRTGPLPEYVQPLPKDGRIPLAILEEFLLGSSTIICTICDPSMLDTSRIIFFSERKVGVGQLDEYHVSNVIVCTTKLS